MKKLSILLVITLSLGILSGCGASSMDTAVDYPEAGYWDRYENGGNPNFEEDVFEGEIFSTKSDSIGSDIMGFIGDIANQSNNSVVYKGAMSTEFPNSMMETENTIVEEETYLDLSAETEIREKEKAKKMVYTARIEIETKEMKSALEEIRGKITASDGYIEQEDIQNLNNVVYSGDTYKYRDSRRAYIKVRVPSEKFEEFINNIETEDKSTVIVNIEKNVVNKTAAYNDFAARLKTRQIEEARLYEYLKEAQTVEEMLSVEKRLSEVQEDIEVVLASMQNIDSDVAYSSVTLCIDEVLKFSDKVENPKGLFGRIGMYIKDSWSNFGNTLEDILAIVIHLFPYALIVCIFCYIFRKKIKVKLEERKYRKALKERKFKDNMEK